ncbi:MAG: aminoacyltransferase, partial [Chloroflexi bacterium]|nr:aminoacyltransferase [Chloroflexota bacterium]
MSISFTHSQQSSWNEEEWDNFVNSHPRAHPLQLHGWGRLKRQWGWEDVRMGMKKGDKWLAGAQILFRPLPHLLLMPFRLAYIPKGPLVDWSDPQLTTIFLQNVHQLCRKKHAILLRIEPELAEHEVHPTLFSDLKFQASRMTVQPRTTLWLDIGDNEDAILANMKQKWRYNIRLSARKGVQVRQGQAEDLPLFGDLIQQTATRNQFGVHPPAYYQQFWQIFAPQDRAALLIAEHEDVPLAAIMVVQLAGKAYYF